MPALIRPARNGNRLECLARVPSAQAGVTRGSNVEGGRMVLRHLTSMS